MKIVITLKKHPVVGSVRYPVDLEESCIIFRDGKLSWNPHEGVMISIELDEVESISPDAGLYSGPHEI